MEKPPKLKTKKNRTPLQWPALCQPVLLLGLVLLVSTPASLHRELFLRGLVLHGLLILLSLPRVSLHPDSLAAQLPMRSLSLLHLLKTMSLNQWSRSLSLSSLLL